MLDEPDIFTNNNVMLGCCIGDQLCVIKATADDADVGVACGETVRDSAQERGYAVLRVTRNQSIKDSAANVACGSGAEELR